jgi:WhiB family redox-sensing transcriptional regulator
VTCRPTVRRSAAATSGAGVAEAAIQPPSLRLPCRIDDPDLWFAESPVQLEQAKALCAGCPIRRSCLTAAIDRREPWGVWGGEIFDQGVVIAHKRPRGRPRKVPVVA